MSDKYKILAIYYLSKVIEKFGLVAAEKCFREAINKHEKNLHNGDRIK